MTQKHTPFKLELGDNSHGFVRIEDAEEQTVAYQYIPNGLNSETGKRLQEQYAFIVRACNSHYELLEALKELEPQYRNRYGDTLKGRKYKTAITKAEAA